MWAKRGTRLYTLATTDNVNPAVPPIRYGRPNSSWSSGTSILLRGCDVRGSFYSPAGYFDVYPKRDQTTLNIGSYDAGNGAASTGCTLGATADYIVAFAMGDDGKWYCIGQPYAFLTQWSVDGSTKLLRAKIRWVVGLCRSSESGWLTLHEGVSCS
jgi:hypothetical protein